MAAAADTQLVTILVNDVELQVPKGELIVEAVKRLGLEIPIFCYHPRMKPVGMCRMCFVEVGFKGPDGTIKKMPKPQAACTLPASEGMAIYTDTELAHRDRKGVLEFLLINHPLDCPICDRGGECPLQNNTQFYGPSTSRYIEMKRHLPKAFPLSRYIKLDLERCIQCGRCVRFTEEISGDAQLAFRFRGAWMQPSTFELTDFTSKFSGNVIEICPVGALTSAEYRFRARPWDLETKGAICTGCSNGCNIWFDYRGDRMVRINGRTNEAINEEWTCDRGKFGHNFYNSPKRLRKPLIRRGDRLEEATWAEAYDEIIRGLKDKRSALLGGAENSNEDLFLAKRTFKNQFGSDLIDHRFQSHLPAAEVAYAQKPIADYEAAKTIVIFGTSLADEEPILFLRMRKAWARHGARVIVVSEAPNEADAFAAQVIRYQPGEELKTAQRLSFDDDRPAIITTQSIYNRPDADKILGVLAKLGELSVYGLHANDQGAQELGFRCDLGTQGILQQAAGGNVEALWLLGCDLLSAHADKDLAQKALEAVPFLVVQSHSEHESMPYASVVLPMCAPAEMEGSYTNVERRVQRMDRVLPTKGEAKPAWRAFSELALRMSGERPYFNPSEVMSEIGKEFPAFAEIDFDRLAGTEGALLGSKRKASPV